MQSRAVPSEESWSGCAHARLTGLPISQQIIQTPGWETCLQSQLSLHSLIFTPGCSEAEQS